MWLSALSHSGIATIAARAKELGKSNLGKPLSTDREEDDGKQ
jgi:hypothetical protein